MNFEYQQKQMQHAAEMQAKQGFAGAGAASSGYPSTAEIRPMETVQGQCADNTEKIRSVNRMLSAVRGKLFGENEIAKDLEKSSPAPSMPSVSGSLYATNEGFQEAFQQLESILARL